LLDWFPNPDHAPLFVAKDKGFFKAENLDVELIGPADPTDPPKLVAAGKADIAITYQPHFLQQVDQGLPLIIFGTLINRPLTCLAVLKENTIHSLSDLKGKRIAYSGGASEPVILNVLLSHAGLSLKDVELIQVHYDLMQALLSGKVDAATGFMRNVELTQLKLMGHPALAFYPEQSGMPTYSELIFVTQKKMARDPRLPRFLKAIQQATAYARANPQTSWETFASQHPELNNELNHQIWLDTLPLFATNPSAFNSKEFIHFAQFMQHNNLIKKVQPLSNYKE
jgi:putative hydroxymethylpyrimidine transport system substrate-binding protein